jgi:hypothetical protein
MDLNGAKQKSSGAAKSEISRCGTEYVNSAIYFPPVILSCGTLLKYFVCLVLIVIIFFG